jgi:hypothetical protein
MAIMRTNITYSIPTDVGNELVKTGKIEGVLKGIIEDFQPEATYFYIDDAGRRAGAFVVDLSEPMDLPRHVEALFFGLSAVVSTRPAFALEDMASLGPTVGLIAEKYG